MNINFLYKSTFYSALCTLIVLHGNALCMNQFRHTPVKNPITRIATPEEFLENTTVFRNEEISDRFGDFAIVAATEILGITGQASEKLKVTCYADIFNGCKFMQYFEPTNDPKVDSLALYLDQSGNLRHAAVVTQATPDHPELCMVKSKWGDFPNIIKHQLLETPNEYNGNIYFYNLKKKFQNKEDLLKLMQDDIKKSSNIEKLLIDAQTTLIALANGTDVSFPMLPSFDTRKNTASKAFYLLQMVVGLDINTHTKEDLQTVTMLAVKRNDCMLLETFLRMNANINKRDINGNTALHFATQNNAFVAVSMLLCDKIDTTIKNNDGLTAYNCAQKTKYEFITLMLKNAQQK